MIFYHSTTEAQWGKIQAEGVLWGVREAPPGYSPDRCTYLAVEQKNAEAYGTVMLRVNYTPTPSNDNYCEGCWQLRVYVPILLSSVERIK